MKKTHIKLKGKALCGVKGKKLQYVSEGAATCLRCIKAIEK